MFNLEQSIAEWCRQMSAAGIKSRDVLDEFEGHLRDDVEQRMLSGAPTKRAFEEAVQQFGAVDKLKLEFGKVSLPQPQFSRRVLRGCCVAVAVFVFLVEGWTLLAFDIALAERISGFTFLAAVACYIGFLPELNRLRPGLSGWALRRVTALVCSYAVSLWVGLLLISLAHPVPLPSGIFWSVVCWSLVAAATMTTVIIAHGTEPDVLNLWTPEVHQSLEVAGAEAARFHHDFIGTEHVLLGLLGMENGAVPNLLKKLGASREMVRAEIEKIVGAGPRSPINPAPPYTPRAKKALALALREARAHHCDHAGVAHLFLGLLREGSGVAAKVLKELGVDEAKARDEILRELANRKNDAA